MKIISYNDYLRLLGLATLGADHRQALNDISRAARAITGDEEEYGHTGDLIWGGRTMEELLRMLGIKVEAPETSALPAISAEEIPGDIEAHVEPPFTTPEDAARQAEQATRIARRLSDLTEEGGRS